MKIAMTAILPPPVEAARDELAALAATCAHRRLVYDLVKADLERWDRMSPSERRAALLRARRRVGAVVPHPTLDLGA